MRKYNIPIFIPHEGCPHDCVFCNQRKITGLTTSLTAKEAESQISTHLSYLPSKDRTVEVAFFGGSFTGLPLSVQEEFYQVADRFKDRIDGIRLSTRPDCIHDEVLTLAEKYGVTMIELGAQSSADKVLAMNNRGHTFSHTIKAVEKIRAHGIGVGLQMMTGMYGSNEELDIQTAEDLAELKPDCVRIYPVLVLKDTHLATLYQKGEYQPQTLDTAIERAKKVLAVFHRDRISVIRLGLHVGEELRQEGTVLAGPFHPALGELVESRLYRDWMEEEWNRSEERPAVFEISVPKGCVSKAIGHKRCNAEYFAQRYGTRLKITEK
ncbi:MAG: radical SAM protein [Clostridia bacterium]|nr:radical SAM protein [Clostridia bacterium]